MSQDCCANLSQPVHLWYLHYLCVDLVVHLLQPLPILLPLKLVPLVDFKVLLVPLIDLMAVDHVPLLLTCA